MMNGAKDWQSIVTWPYMAIAKFSADAAASATQLVKECHSEVITNSSITCHCCPIKSAQQIPLHFSHIPDARVQHIPWLKLKLKVHQRRINPTN